MKYQAALWLYNETVGRTIENQGTAEQALSAFGGAVMGAEAPTTVYFGPHEANVTTRKEAAAFLRMWADAMEDQP